MKFTAIEMLREILCKCWSGVCTAKKAEVLNENIVKIYTSKLAVTLEIPVHNIIKN